VPSWRHDRYGYELFSANDKRERLRLEQHTCVVLVGRCHQSEGSLMRAALLRLFVTSLPILILAALAGDGWAAASSALNFVVRAGEYHGTAYVAAPAVPAEFVTFGSEPLSISLAIGNPTSSDHSLNLTGSAPIDGFHVTVIRVPADATAVPSLLIEPVAEVANLGVKTEQRWLDAVPLPAGSNIVWKGSLSFSGRPTPGIYELRVTPLVRDSDGSPLNPLGTMVRYEVRDILSRDDRAEVARRRMMHAYTTDADVVAEASANALLAIYPQSALAYQVKGEAARREGRIPDAIQSFEMAATLLTSGADQLFLRYAQPTDVNPTISGLKRTIERLRR
jgi:hypothetical protein